MRRPIVPLARTAAIGAKVTLTTNGAAEMSQTMFQTDNYNVSMEGFALNLPSAATRYVSGPIPPAGANLAGIDNEDYDAIAAKALAMT
jgi:peptide/nickel transport system substrate-binding protein